VATHRPQKRETKRRLWLPQQIQEALGPSLSRFQNQKRDFCLFFKNRFRFEKRDKEGDLNWPISTSTNENEKTKWSGHDDKPTTSFSRFRLWKWKSANSSPLPYLVSQNENDI
jgi:hypothetical protein